MLPYGDSPFLLLLPLDFLKEATARWILKENVEVEVGRPRKVCYRPRAGGSIGISGCRKQGRLMKSEASETDRWGWEVPWTECLDLTFYHVSNRDPFQYFKQDYDLRTFIFKKLINNIGNEIGDIAIYPSAIKKK